MKLILTDLEKANQIAQTVKCLARRQRRMLSGTPTRTHIKMIKFESNETADLDDKQTEAGVENPLVAQVVAEGGTDTKAPLQSTSSPTRSS